MLYDKLPATYYPGRKAKMEANMQRTWKPTVGGILNIITGALSVIFAILIIIAILTIGSINMMQYLPAEQAPFILPVIVPTLIGFLVITIIIAVFSLLGGIFALQRRKWGWALTGSIIAIIGISTSIFTWGLTRLLWILATIFISTAKEEFE